VETGTKWADARPGLMKELARAHRYHEGCLNALGREAEAQAARRKAVAILDELCKKFPKDPMVRFELGATYSNIRAHAMEVEDVRKGAKILRELVAEFPGFPEFRRNLAVSLDNLAVALEFQKRYEEAAEPARQALALRRQLFEYYPQVLEYRKDLAISLFHAARAATLVNQPRKALDWYGEAIRTLAPVGTDPVTRSMTREAHKARFELFMRLNRHAEAFEEVEEAIKIASSVLLRAWRAEALSYIDPDRAVAEAEALYREVGTPEHRNGVAAADAALIHALAAAKVTDGRKADRFAARCVELLHKALEKGAFDYAHWRKTIREAPPFRRLGERDDFKAFLAALEAKYR
jgi:tetratricopeptide (TPR) repeat protein